VYRSLNSHMMEFVSLRISYLECGRLNIFMSNELVSFAGVWHLLLIIPSHIPCAQVFTNLYRWENTLCNIQIGNKFPSPEVVPGKHLQKLFILLKYISLLIFKKCFILLVLIMCIYVKHMKNHNRYIVIDFKFQIH
jgi:hypothetical protein